MSEGITWGGYAYDVPAGPRPESGRHAAELDLRQLLYSRVLSQLGRKSATGEGELILESWRASLGPWTGESSPEYLRPVCGALFGARFCGQGAGLHRECESDEHGFWTPLGCGSPWCLRCSGVAADARSSRVHRDIRLIADTCAMITGKRPPVVRIILTLSNESRPGVVASGRLGASEMLRHARVCIRRAAGSDGTLPLMLTLHPTSSSRPWLKRPHIEAFALWSDVGDDPRALAWAAKGPLDAGALRSSWSSLYPGSIELHASYYSYDTDRDRYVRPGRGRGQSLASGLRYALRGFNEDVWWAAAGQNLGVPGGSMRELLDPRRTPALRGTGSTPGEVVAGLEADGGVLLWKGFHRVRRSGALAARGFRSLLAELRNTAGMDPVDHSELCKCPECGERLVAQTYEDDEGRQRVVLLRVEKADEFLLKLLPGLGRVAQGVTS